MALLQVDYFSGATILSVCLAIKYIQAGINFIVAPEGNLCVTFRSVSSMPRFIESVAVRGGRRALIEISRHPIHVALSQKLFLAVGH